TSRAVVRRTRCSRRPPCPSPATSWRARSSARTGSPASVAPSPPGSSQPSPGTGGGSSGGHRSGCCCAPGNRSPQGRATMADVVIAGAGPVGLLLGCLLAGRGADVLIVEKRRGADARSRAIGIHPPGVAALDDAGIGAAVRAEAVVLERGEVHARGRMLASVRFGTARPVMTLAQQRTDALLRAR